VPGGGGALVGVCAGTTRSGGRCTVSVSGAHEGFCHLHDPARADARRRAASKAARSRPSREVASLKAELRVVIDGALDGRIERGVGSCAAQLYNVLLRAVEVERKVRESAELEARLEALEGALRSPVPVGGEARWRA
jgi:hypothetical protein